jgi:hypothetical protein
MITGGDDHGGGHGDEGEDDHGGDDGHDHGAATEADLAVGQQIEVTFLAFDGSPFLAHKIQIDDRRPDFEGRIVDVAGLPTSLVPASRAARSGGPVGTGGVVAEPTWS